MKLRQIERHDLGAGGTRAGPGPEFLEIGTGVGEESDLLRNRWSGWTARRPARRSLRGGSGSTKKSIRMGERGSAWRRRAADPPADGEIMEQSVDAHVAVEVFPMVPSGGKRRPNLATFAMTVLEIMQDRVDALPLQVEIAFDVAFRIEQLVRPEAAGMAALEVMRQGAAVAERNLVVLRVPAGMKNPARPIAVAFAEVDVMDQRIGTAPHDIEIGQKVPSRVEKRIWIAPVAPTGAQVMVERIDPGRGNVGVAQKILVRIEQVLHARPLRSLDRKSTRLNSS